MAQSVKLSDGSYIDASAVYDTDRQETVEDALKVSKIDLTAQIKAKGYTASTAYAVKRGHLVTLQVAAKPGSSQTAADTPWFTLPEGYRPHAHLEICGQELMGGKTNLYFYVGTDGICKSYTAITALNWWAFNTTYWVD